MSQIWKVTIKFFVLNNQCPFSPPTVKVKEKRWTQWLRDKRHRRHALYCLHENVRLHNTSRGWFLRLQQMQQNVSYLLKIRQSRRFRYSLQEIQVNFKRTAYVCSICIFQMCKWWKITNGATQKRNISKALTGNRCGLSTSESDYFHPSNFLAVRTVSGLLLKREHYENLRTEWKCLKCKWNSDRIPMLVYHFVMPCRTYDILSCLKIIPFTCVLIFEVAIWKDGVTLDAQKQQIVSFYEESSFDKSNYQELFPIAVYLDRKTVPPITIQHRH